MKCYDNDEAISNKESNQHPCSPPREAATLTKPRDHVLAQESFKTPTSVKSAELVCPPTPLKRRSLRQNNMGSPVRINEEAFVDEQHSDPETPLGFRTKFTKQAKKAGGKEKQPQSQERSMYNEHNQQVQKREEQMDIETENEGQQSDPRSVKQQELARSSKPCSDHPSAKQPTISTCTHNGYALRKCQRLVPDTFSKDKDSSVSIAQPSQSMKEDAINDKHQQSSTNMDVEMSQTRSSDDLFGLTQYSTQHLETQKAVQDLSPMRDMQEDSAMKWK
ncbi:hypothetical protein HPB50_020596 [Hyalomma asiaticum]|uniref:Uncharacterized protein n=1 Tax=Hyalomma asiaticum TaxID=266040 RepID=A0ACB7SRX1_HYAAI|nr:hypothetical protein HPB50_020596 [Hyalomma asiaticum]